MSCRQVRCRRLLGRLTLCFAIGLVGWIPSGCHPLRIATDQVIKEVPGCPGLGADEKTRMRLAQTVKTFAETQIGLARNQNYSACQPDNQSPMLWVVHAARRDRIEAETWKSDNVGKITYRTFPDRKQAEAERERLIKQGLEAHVREAPAYSTLGKSVEPITPRMLKYGEVVLAEILIHELTHATFYVPSQTQFSESLAKFVEEEGALEFLKRHYASDGSEVRDYLERIHDERLFNAFIVDAAERLDGLYAGRPADVEAARRKFFERVLTELEGLKPKFQVLNYRLTELNNAIILYHLTYADTFPFEMAFAAGGRNWPEFWKLVREAAKSERPTDRLLELIRPAGELNRPE